MIIKMFSSIKVTTNTDEEEVEPCNNVHEEGRRSTEGTLYMANHSDIRAQMSNSKDHTKQPVNRSLSSLIYIAVGLIS